MADNTQSKGGTSTGGAGGGSIKMNTSTPDAVKAAADTKKQDFGYTVADYSQTQSTKILIKDRRSVISALVLEVLTYMYEQPNKFAAGRVSLVRTDPCSSGQFYVNAYFDKQLKLKRII